VTSPDKPETTDVPADAPRDEHTVATASPTPESTSAVSGAPANGAKSTGPSAGTSAITQPGTPETAQPATPAQAGSTAPNARPAEEPPTVIAPVTGSQPEGPDVTSSVPPWQRVPSDAQHVAAQSGDLPGDGSRSEAEKTTRFTDWGYQRGSRSDTYSEHSADATEMLDRGGSGSAASSAFPAASGQPEVRADALPGSDPNGRTTVNFGTPAAARPQGATGPGAPSALRRPGRGPRRASLQVKRVDPWSVLKLAFVLSVALFFVWLVAVGVLYGVLDGMGVWNRVNGTVNEFAANSTSASSGPLITASRVFGIAAVIGAINIVLFTALATVGSFVYNVSADLAGGLEITLAERE
jgi:hypothetical protein